MGKIPKDNDVLLKIVIGVLTTALTGLFIWIWTAQNKLTAMSINQDNLVKKVDGIVADHSVDAKQDSQLSKHWQLHNWERDAIHELDTKVGLPLAKWPTFGNPQN